MQRVGGADAHEVDAVAVALADAPRPAPETSAVPFEAMIGMAKLVRRHAVERVVLAIRRGQQHGARAQPAEEGALHPREAVRLDVFEALHQRGGVEPAEVRIRVFEGAVAHLHPIRGAREADPERQARLVEALLVDVDADEARELSPTGQAPQQLARAAAEIQHPGGSALQEVAHHAIEALLVQALGCGSGFGPRPTQDSTQCP